MRTSLFFLEPESFVGLSAELTLQIAPATAAALRRNLRRVVSFMGTPPGVTAL
jgi:hypothetical protein